MVGLFCSAVIIAASISAYFVSGYLLNTMAEFDCIALTLGEKLLNVRPIDRATSLQRPTSPEWAFASI